MKVGFDMIMECSNFKLMLGDLRMQTNTIVRGSSCLHPKIASITARLISRECAQECDKLSGLKRQGNCEVAGVAGSFLVGVANHLRAWSWR